MLSDKDWQLFHHPYHCYLVEVCKLATFRGAPLQCHVTVAAQSPERAMRFVAEELGSQFVPKRAVHAYQLEGFVPND